MARETSQINRDIVDTRREIDDHLRELSGRVRGGLNVQTQARRNLPVLLGGLAVAGLVAGLALSARRGISTRHRESTAERELARLRSDIAAEYDYP